MESSKITTLEKQKKKSFFQKIGEMFKNLFTEISNRLAMLMLPKRIKEQMYERTILGKAVYEGENDKREEKKEENKNVNKDVDKELNVDKQSKKEIEPLDKEKEYDELYQKAAKMSLGIEMEDYIKLITLARELDKEPRYINITGKDEKTYYISTYEKNGEIHPCFKDNTDRSNVVAVSKEDMQRVFNEAKSIKNHVMPIVKNNAIPYYDFNKSKIQKRLNEILEKNLIKSMDIKEKIKDVLEKNNVYDMSVLYNAVSSQPDIAAHFHKAEKTLTQYATLGADIPSIVLRMDFIDKIAELGNFDLKDEIITLKVQMENNKEALKQILNIDVSKYDELIKNTETEIIYSDDRIEPVVINETKEISLTPNDLSMIYSENVMKDLNEIISGLNKDNIYIPNSLVNKINELTMNSDYDSIKEIVDVLAKCPTENVDCYSHACEDIQKNTGLKEYEAIFYDDYLYITGLERLSQKYQLPELKEFENQEKEKFVQKLATEYQFVYTKPKNNIISAIEKDIERIAESVGFEIEYQNPEQENIWFAPVDMNREIVIDNEMPIPIEPINCRENDDFEYR